MNDTPITFTALSYALFDEDKNTVLTTRIVNLAIFSTKGIAEAMARTSVKRLKVIPVRITPEVVQ